MKDYFLLFSLLLFKFTLSIPHCEIGINNCTKCNYMTNLCIKCSLDIYIPDKNGGCELSKKCSLGKNYCNECSDNLDKCKICENGYFPDENGGCTYTDNCQLSYRGECLKCKDNYILIGGKSNLNNLKICKYLFSEDLKNCENINLNNGICNKCKNGFYMNKGDNRCTKTENCNESTLGICTQCIRNYYLNKKENKCLPQEGLFIRCKETLDGKNCEICDDNYYLAEDGKCSQNNFCKKVGNSSLCGECITGYYKSEYQSICSVTDNCYFADTDTGLCRSCQKNYCLDQKDGICKSNQENNKLKYCRTANDLCIDCPYPYFLGEDSKCSTSRYCATSENGICNSCPDNYYLGLDNICTDIKNCIYSQNYYSCNQCIDKYYYDEKNRTCLPEKEGFINCQKTDYQGKFCGKCRENFYLNKKDNLCYNNEEFGKFYKCEKTNIDAGHCIQCAKDYYLGKKSNRCWKIEGCEMSSDDIKCDECDNLHVLNAQSGKCEINNKIIDENKKFYYKCNKTDEEGNSCETCMDNYTLNDNGICQDDIHCIEKTNGVCNKCQKKEDETLNYCSNIELGCVETNLNNCLECNDVLDFNKCSKCDEGYELDEKNTCKEIKKE